MKSSHPFLLAGMFLAAAVTSTIAAPSSNEVRSPFFRAADTAYRHGDIAGAEKMVNDQLATNPTDSEALLMRSRVRFATRDIAGVEADLNAVIVAGGPLAGAGYGQLAALRLGQKRFPDAAEAIGKALELTPDQPDALLAQASLDMQQKNTTAALDKITRAIAVRPNFEEAFGARAMILAQMGRGDEGVQILKENLAKNPQSIMLHVQLVGLYMKVLQIEMMRSEIKEIAKLPDPRVPQVVAQLTSATDQLQARMAQAISAATVPAATPVQSTPTKK